MSKKRRPGRRVVNPIERTCKTCGVLKPIDGFQAQNRTREQEWVTYRHSCLECETAKAVARYYARKDRKKCSRCGVNLPIEGRAVCKECYDINKEAKEKSWIKLRTIFLVKYGRKCQHCGDPRIQCLEIDHIGGWGKEHRDRKDRRIGGQELMRWAKANNFPDTIRLLCGSCHSSLSYYGVLPQQRYTNGTLEPVAPHTDVSTD